MDMALNTLEPHSGKLHPFSSTFSRKCQAPLVPGGLTSHQCFLISFFIKERGSLTLRSLQGEARTEQHCRVSPSLFFEGHLHFTASQTGFRFGMDYEISCRKKIASQLEENCY